MSQTRDAATVGPDPDLSLAEIWAPISENKNKLVQDDYGIEPKAVIPLYEEHEVGDKISLYWGESTVVPDVEYELAAGDLGRHEIGFRVPWSYIKGAGKGDIPVWYTITPDDADAPVQKSTRTFVTVEAVAAAVEPD
ncbi:hypothetical protein ACFU7Y_02685 [Kitasatospora sp. NPDC057542]|uniref:hypothetical protein n=1 Tax=Streptomycetaceae TaxID=2062 RepID=UPI001CCC6174|nr:hypothetical protein [Streptomyces sp. LS1784]